MMLATMTALVWLDHVPRTLPGLRQNARKWASWFRAKDEMLAELRLIEAHDVTISTDYSAGVNDCPSDPGVVVSFTRRNKRFAIACDRWTKPGDNLQTINRAIGAIRGIGLGGTPAMLNQALGGFRVPMKPVTSASDSVPASSSS